MTEEHPQAAEYVRTLTDEELLGLNVDIAQRTLQVRAALHGQGMDLPLQEMENHHIIGLLECFIGPEQALRVREWHLTWMDKELDRAEAAVRLAMFAKMDAAGMAPPANADGIEQFLNREQRRVAAKNGHKP